ncbi:MAG: hypothetical protein EDM74_13425, partial [Armatimonadetes bacterium]
MPRPLVFGNGIFHLCLDAGHRIRDLYFPQCGLPNHLSGHAIRWGFWCEEKLSWVGDEGWEVRQRYDPSTLCGLTQLESSELRIVVEVREADAPVRGRLCVVQVHRHDLRDALGGAARAD